MPQRVVPVTPALERSALDFLAASPFENVFLCWLLRDSGMQQVRSWIFAHCDDAGNIDGIAFFGRQIVLATHSGAAIRAFAETAKSYRRERMIVAPRSTVELFWSEVKRWHSPPRLVRESQPLLAVDRKTLKRERNGVAVRRARPAEWRTVANNSARMVEQELAYSPRAASMEFDANVRQTVDRGLWWVAEDGGELCFFCNAGPRSDATLQLQGIWTPPEHRGKGVATAALGAIAAELLAETPTLSLYVNDFNAPALALYRRVGFYRVGELSTLLF